MKFGLISLETLIGYFVVLIIYIVAIFPIIRDNIAAVTGADEFTTFIFGLLPAVFLIAIMAGIINYARGVQPSGAWGGESYE